MKQDKETKMKLLASARAEFLDKGYMKASLRTICKNAGVTTGALYFFFRDKADLFEALTKDVVEAIYAVVNGHFSIEHDMAKKGELGHPEDADNHMHYDDSQRIIHMMYEHRDDVLLVLTKSQGSTMEGLVDRFIDTAEQHFKNMAREMEQMYPDKKVDDGFIHWLAHEQIGAFVYMITHIEDEERGMKFMEQLISYMIAGWYGVFMN